MPRPTRLLLRTTTLRINFELSPWIIGTLTTGLSGEETGEHRKAGRRNASSAVCLLLGAERGVGLP